MSHADPFGQWTASVNKPCRVLSKAKAARRVNAFDINAWLDAHDDAPAREELEPDYSDAAREAA